MAGQLPVGIATKLVTLGKYYGADGTLSTSWSAVATIDRELRWVATGDAIEQINMKVVLAGDGSGSVRLPVTDQGGFVDASGSVVTGWYYTMTWTSQDFVKRQRVFQLPGAAPDPFDVDNVAVGSSVPPTNPSVTYVNSVTVNGVTQSGAVVIDTTAGTPASSTAGITDMTAFSRSLAQTADQNSALTVLGIADLRGLIASLTTALTTLQGTVTAQAATITGLTTGKVDKTAVGVTVAPLDGSLKLPLANLTPSAMVEQDAVGGVYPPRLATVNTVSVFGPTPGPASGGSTSGGGGYIDGKDHWNVTAT